jgi:pyrimidine deaminase RibD-like protein
MNFMQLAFELSQHCPPTQKAFSVGAVIVDDQDRVLATGYSREWGESWHAEEVALAKLRELLKQNVNPSRPLRLYSTLEPCGERASGRQPCADHIVKMGIEKVIYCAKEPKTFIDHPRGVARLKQAMVAVEQQTELISAVEDLNCYVWQG